MRPAPSALRADDGAGAVEYALIVVAIAAVLALVVYGLGALTRSNVDATCQAWTDAAASVDATSPTC